MSLSSASHFFLIPESIDEYKLRTVFLSSQFLRMPDWFFKSIDHYNVLMLQENFYRKLLDFEFVLICQSDAFVIGGIDQLLHYDYFGASWKSDYRLTETLGQLFVNRPNWLLGKSTSVSAGNGGLSLRNTSRMLELIEFGKTKPFWHQFERVEKRKLNEDVIFSFLGTQRGLRIPTRIEADRFFAETNKFEPEALGELIGFHALEKYQPGVEERVLKVLGIGEPK